MSVRWRSAALAAVLPLMLASCTSSPPATTDRGEAQQTQVDVSTPQLRMLKRRAGVEACESSDAKPVAGGMPDVTLACLGGGPDSRLAGFRGPMVVNLFAQWCGPCRKELPYYQKLHEKAGDKVGVVGIDYLDSQPRRALELVKATGVTYPLLADPGELLRAPFRVRGLPLLVMVDARGKIVFRQFVAVDSYAQLRDLVAAHLGVTLRSTTPG